MRSNIEISRFSREQITAPTLSKPLSIMAKEVGFNLGRLTDILSLARPYKGLGQYMLIKYIIAQPLREKVGTDNVTIDDAGNVFVDLRTDESHRTMMTAHTDTVHRTDGFQQVDVDEGTGTITTSDGYCLGADDGAGIAVMLHMIEAKVPALYVFPTGEEVGGIGASWMVENTPEVFENIDRAIALDRRDTWSVITHQGGRTCSDEFGHALANALNEVEPEFMYTIDDTGVYTDTAEFVCNVQECTNLSVGYYNEHSGIESLDCAHLIRLAVALTKIDLDALPTVREKGQDSWWSTETSYGMTDYFMPYGAVDRADMFSQDLINETEQAVYCAREGDIYWLYMLVADAQILHNGANEADVMELVYEALDDTEQAARIVQEYGQRLLDAGQDNEAVLEILDSLYSRIITGGEYVN